MKYLFSLLFIPLIFCQCNSPKDKIVINRFDKELLYIIENYSDTASAEFEKKYSDILSIYYSAIIKGSTDSLTNNKSKYSFIANQISNPNFKRLYSNAISEYNDMSYEEYVIGKGMTNYSKLFKNSFTPSFYTHISPFGYSIITTDSLISISLDNYMGCDYEGYKDVFYNYQLPKKNRSRIIPDIFRAWIYAKYPNKANTLVEGMIYEGSVIYAIEYILDDYNAIDIIGYDKTQNKWCKENEEVIWNAIIESNHLYSKDNMVYIKYMNEAPYCTALKGDVPAEIGKWIGYRIISKYINKNGIESLIDILKGDIKTVEILKSYK